MTRPTLTVFTASNPMPPRLDAALAGQVETLAHLGAQYRVIEAMAEGFTITTEDGDTYHVAATDDGLGPWVELARQHLNERVACIARTVAAFSEQKRTAAADVENGQ